MKRSILVALLVVIGLSGVVSATTVSVSAPSIYPTNKDVTVTIKIDSVQDLSHFKIVLDYDENRLNYKSYSIGGDFSEWSVSANDDGDKITITGDTDEYPVTGDNVVVARITFTTTAAGTAEFTFGGGSYLQDIGYADIETTWQGASMDIGNPSITADVPQSVTKDKTYIIEIKGNYLYDIAAFQFVIDYDQNYLSINNVDNDVTLGDDLSGWNIKQEVVTDENGNKMLKVIAYYYPSGQTFTGSGTLFKIKFTATSDGNPDWTNFFSTVKLSDSNAQDATPTTIQTNTYTIGDVNGDTHTDILDLVAMINLILNNQYDPKADLNADGVVDATDLTELVNQL